MQPEGLVHRIQVYSTQPAANAGDWALKEEVNMEWEIPKLINLNDGFIINAFQIEGLCAGGSQDVPAGTCANGPAPAGAACGLGSDVTSDCDEGGYAY